MNGKQTAFHRLIVRTEHERLRALRKMNWRLGITLFWLSFTVGFNLSDRLQTWQVMHRLNRRINTPLTDVEKACLELAGAWQDS